MSPFFNVKKEVIPLRSDELTQKQERFIQNIVSGMNQREAYKDAYDAENMKESSIDKEAYLLIRNPKVAKRYREMLDELKDVAIMSATERMIWLSEVVQGIKKEREAIVIDGDVVIKDVEANLTTKLKALDTLNKMSGEYITKVEADVNSEMNINIELSDD